MSLHASQDQHFNVQIGINLRKLRTRNALSQHKLGEILGITYQQVQKYESGKNRLPLESFVRLKTYFTISYEELFEGISPVNNSEESISVDTQITESLCRLKDHQMKQKILKIIHILCS